MAELLRIRVQTVILRTSGCGLTLEPIERAGGRDSDEGRDCLRNILEEFQSWSQRDNPDTFITLEVLLEVKLIPSPPNSARRWGAVSRTSDRLRSHGLGGGTSTPSVQPVISQIEFEDLGSDCRDRTT